MVQTGKRVEEEEHDCAKSVLENKENIVHVEQYSPVNEISAELKLSEEIDNIALDSEEEKQTTSAVPQVQSCFQITTSRKLLRLKVV